MKKLKECLSSFLAIDKKNQSLPPFFQLLLYGFSFLHLSYAFQQSKTFNSILKWLDVSQFIDHLSLLYIFLVFCVIHTLFLTLLLLKLGNKKHFRLTITENYGIRIIHILGLVISHPMCLPIIRTSISCIQMNEIYIKILSSALLLLFFMIYIFYMFIANGLSPDQNSASSQVIFPNSITIFNLSRLISYIIASTVDQKFIAIPASIFGSLLTIGLIKRPLLTWRFNKFYQIYISLVIWISFCKVVGKIPNQQIGEVYYLLGMPIIAIFFQYVVSISLILILRSENQMVKLKSIYYLITNIQSYRIQLNIFFLDHFEKCQNYECQCNSILRLKRRQKNKSESENNCLAKLYFGLLFSIQKQFYQQNIVSGQSQVKLQQVLIDIIQVLHRKLNRNYQSIQYLWRAKHYIEEDAFGISSYYVRWLIQRENLYESLQQNIRQSSNGYALDFYDLQVKTQSYRKSLLKTVKNTIQFWKQLVSQNPDKQTLIITLNKLLKEKLSLINKKKIFTDGQENYKRKMNCQYDPSDIIRKQIHKIDDEYRNLFTGKKNCIQKENQIYQSKHVEISDEYKMFSIKITGMAIVCIDQGQSFGDVLLTNSKFWQIIDQRRYNRPNVNNFLPRELHNAHNQIMKSFLFSNKYSFHKHGGYILNGKKRLIQIKLSIQILTDLVQGLRASVFLTENLQFNQKPSFMATKKGQILYFNNTFENQIVNNEKYISQLFIDLVQRRSSPELIVGGDVYKVEFVEGLNQSDPIYCQLNKIYHELEPQSSVKQNNKSQLIVNLQENKISNPQLQAKQSEKEKVKKDEVKYITEEQQQMNIEVGKQVKQLMKWKRILFFLFFFKLALSLSFSTLNQYRSAIFRSGINSAKQVNTMISTIVQTSILARQINVLTFNNVSFDQTVYLEQFERLGVDLEIALEKKKWDQNIKTFDINNKGQIVQKQLPFEALLHLEIISNLNSYKNDKQKWNFNYTDEIKLRMTPYFFDIFQIVCNSLYSLVPKVSESYRLETFEIWKNKIEFPVPIVPLVSILVIIGLAALFFTAALDIKLQQIHHEILLLLQQVPLPEVQQRICLLNTYLNKLSKLVQISSNHLQNSQRSLENQAQLLENIQNDTKIVCIEKSQRTEVAFGETQQDCKNKEINQKQRIVFNAGKLRKRYDWVHNILVFLIILSAPLALLSVQLSTINFLVGQLKLLDFQFQQIENILISAAYLNEFNYQISYFKNKDSSMARQIPITINKYYEISRKIDQYNDAGYDQYTKIKRAFKEKQFCLALGIYFELQSCSQMEKNIYSKKLQSQLMVEYIEGIRKLFLQRLSLGDQPTFEEVKKFSNGVRLMQIKHMSNRLQQIQKQKAMVLMKDMQLRIVSYERSMFCCSLISIGVLIAGIFWWYPRKRDQLRRLAEKSKLLIQMIKTSSRKVIAQHEKSKLSRILQ